MSAFLLYHLYFRSFEDPLRTCRCKHHEMSSQLGHAPSRPLIIGHYESNLGDFHQVSSDKNGELCGSDCPKTPCDPRGRGDKDRTRAKGQQWAYCPGPAWYGLTGTRLRQQISLNLCSYLQLLNGVVVE